jgi:hypothetical protein
MAPAQFSVDPATEEGFFVIVGEKLTVYESYPAAIGDVKDKITTDSDSFLAEVSIENGDSEDVAINLEQVGWQQIIADMSAEEVSQQ